MTKTWSFSKGQPSWGLAFSINLEDGMYSFLQTGIDTRKDKHGESYDVLRCKINGKNFMLPYKATKLSEGVAYPSNGNCKIASGLLADITAAE